MALDVRETYLRDCSVHSYFSRVLLDALSVPPLGQVFYAPRMPPTPRSRKFSQKFVEKIDFAHRLDDAGSWGSRQLRAVKIPASYDAWRPPKCRKTDSQKVLFVWSRKSVFRHFSWILEELDNFRHQNQLQHRILF